MNFGCDVFSCASRPIEAMMWTNNIESAKSIADMRTSYSITGAKLKTNFEVLDSQNSEGSQEDHQRRLEKKGLHLRKNLHRKNNAFSREARRWHDLGVFQGQRHRRIRNGPQ